MADHHHPLAGITIIELASVLAGPLAGSFFAELGARVIKIENKKAGGDVTRQWKMPIENANSSISAYYASANTAKEILFLDLADDADYKQLSTLIAEADIVLSNYQKRTAEKLKVDYDALVKYNEKVIFAQLVAYEYNDPRPGYDLVMQAESGFISMNGTTAGEMVKMPVALIDVIAGHQIKEAILLSMLQKSKTDKGCFVEISLYKSAISALANQASNYLMNDHIPKPMGTLHPNIAPYGDIFTTKNQKAIILAVGSDAQFEKLGKTLNFDAAHRHTFRLNKERVSNRARLTELLQAKISEFEAQDLSDALQESNVPFCEIADMKAVFQNPIAQEMIITEQIENKTVQKVRNVAFRWLK